MFFKKQPPGRLIALGFVLVILLGALILMLPVSHNEGVSISVVDALFTSTSAVCVTGLVVVDTADTYNAFGQTVIAFLIQIGGLGVTCIGVSFFLIAGKRIGLKERLLIKESWSIDSFHGVVKLVKDVLMLTLVFEAVGALLSFVAFSRNFPPLKALGISVFHSVATFNNSGFDILGGFKSLIDYQNDVLLNLVTCGLIIFGGLGFLVILDIMKNRRFKKLSLHSKAVVTMTITLLLSGTLLLKLTENITWLGAFFYSTSARTAGFSTYTMGNFSNAALLVITALMFIGASPASTGGGIKTTTFFALLQTTKSIATNSPCTTFKRKLPTEVTTKAFIVALLSVFVVCIGTFLLTVIEPQYSLMQLLFEETSAFGTVGLSTGITPALHTSSKVVLMLTMFIGRLGALTIVSMWVFKPTSQVSFSEETIMIG